MAQRRPWNSSEDQILKHLKEIVKVNKWSQISRIMEKQYKIYGRNGKQCRERYTNHLDSSIITKEITDEQQNKLFELHNQIGNKWSVICKEFVGRTDNHLKNHFHSKLRKALRKLNKQIKLNFAKTIRPYKLNLIYKIVESSDYRFYSHIKIDDDVKIFFNELKNTLLQYANGKAINSSLLGVSKKDHTKYLISQFEIFDKNIKNFKIYSKLCQNDIKSQSIVTDKKSKNNLSTSNSDCSCEMQLQISQQIYFGKINVEENLNKNISTQILLIQSPKKVETGKISQKDKQLKQDEALKNFNNTDFQFSAKQIIYNNRKQKQIEQKQNSLQHLIESIDFLPFNSSNNQINAAETLREVQQCSQISSKQEFGMNRFDCNHHSSIYLF